MFEAHLTVWAFPLALPKAGKSSPARIAMMAITTSNSINVKPAEQSRLAVAFAEFDGGDFMSFCRGLLLNAREFVEVTKLTPLRHYERAVFVNRGAVRRVADAVLPL